MTPQGVGPQQIAFFQSHKAPDERDEQDGAVAVSGLEAPAPLKCTPNLVVSGAGAILVRYNFPPAALSQLSRSLMGLAEVRTMPLSLSDSPHHELIYTPGHHCDFKKHA